MKLTQTELTFLADCAQKETEQLRAQLANIGFVVKSVQLVGSEATTVVTRASYKDDYLPDLEEVGRYNAFTAWAKETVKRREKEIDEVNDSFYEPTDSPEPAKTDWTPDECFADEEEWTRYLTCEALASTYGKFIHKEGAFLKAKAEAINAELHPVELATFGPNNVVYHYESCPLAGIEAMEKTMLGKYRGYEAALNRIKAELKRRATVKRVEALQANRKALSEWSAENSRLRADFEKNQKLRLQEIATTKIEVPDAWVSLVEELRATYQAE